jgi:acyl-CoA thioesterase
MEALRVPAFLGATRVESVAGVPGRYVCELDDAWTAPVIPFGGLMSAVAVRAMQAALPDAAHTLRTVTTTFASQVPVGRAEIDVEVLRAGRGMSQLMARVRSREDHGPGHVTTAVFGSDRHGFEFTDLAAPDAPPPLQCAPPEDPPPEYAKWRARVFEHFDWRRVTGHAPWQTDWQAGGPAEMVRWMRFIETPRLPTGELDPIAYLTLADFMPGGIGQKLGPAYPIFWGFSCDLTLHFFETTRSEWILQRIRCRRAHAGYASGELEMWDEDRRLIAYATQMMFLSFPKDTGMEGVGR